MMKKRIQILIVGKPEPEVIHYRSLLTSQGVEIISAANSFEAVRQFNAYYARKTPFDLVMASYNLSGSLNGLSLVRIFLNVHPSLKITLFPSADLFDREVRRECDEIRASILEAGFSATGLRRMIEQVRKEIEIKE